MLKLRDNIARAAVLMGLVIGGIVAVVIVAPFVLIAVVLNLIPDSPEPFYNPNNPHG